MQSVRQHLCANRLHQFFRSRQSGGDADDLAVFAAEIDADVRQAPGCTYCIACNPVAYLCLWKW